MLSKPTYRSPLNPVLAFGLLASAAVFSGSALAGQCPADKVMEGAVTSGESAPVGVTDDVLSAIDLSSKGDAFKGQMLRLRKLVVQPGGVVPWHSHETRPANITIVEGSITEYSSNCKVPIVHKAGDTIPEFGNFSHWWKNTSKKKAVLFSADLLPPATDDHMM